MRKALRYNGLSTVMFGLFAVFLLFMSFAGVREYNQEQTDHGEQPVSYVEYLTTGHFVEATFENWESEFLQMGGFVLLTVWLRQKGSPESKKLEGDEPVDEDPRDTDREDAPWAARVGGVQTWLYERSLSIALFTLFFLSFAMHAAGGAKEYSSEQLAHGGEAVGTLGYLKTSQFWFESFQNWQSEFLAVGALVVLSVYLRQKGSPESKPVATAHSETGTEGGFNWSSQQLNVEELRWQRGSDSRRFATCGDTSGPLAGQRRRGEKTGSDSGRPSPGG